MPSSHVILFNKMKLVDIIINPDFKKDYNYEKIKFNYFHNIFINIILL